MKEHYTISSIYFGASVHIKEIDSDRALCGRFPGSHNEHTTLPAMAFNLASCKGCQKAMRKLIDESICVS